MLQCARDFENLITHIVGRLKDLRVPEPEDVPALALQPLRAALVTETMSGMIMLTAIEFDDQTNFRTSEIGHIGPNRMLTPKLQPIRPLPQ